MNTLARIAVSLLVAAVAFGLVTVGVTAGFQPWIEFSLLVGLPVGLFAGLTALFAAYAELRYRDEEGPPSPTTRRMRWAAAAAVVDFVAVTALSVVVFFVDGTAGLGLLIFGLPASLVITAVAGYLAADRLRGDGGGPRSSSG